MNRLKLILIIFFTAGLSAAVTSAFWLAAFNRGHVEDRSAPAAPVAPQARAPDLVLGPSGLAIPVLGVKAQQLSDTFTQARSGGRVHDAIDIMAPHGTPVVAAAPGTLEKLFFSKGGGGITAYVRSPDGKWLFYYAHLQDYAAGLHEGQAIRQGDPIGRVGSTGNANPAGPHLHFAVYQMAPGQKWYDGTPVNPYPLLAGRR
ncbi:MAG: M23 family metallopeptidase [Alphaproteobacteria bacterium]|nr:M23 family metallopeptidase [Alphaproteobacteria bacterium]MBV9370210.1 M23 family metallopeptidase [Alphaproteobacteria bacterium]MBV9901433.1 M23 family metallopeptidase [Alphaproteobacteria bacterium]